jgi:preprotein translocase subunit YajC
MVPAPAIIATLFNVLSGYTMEALKSVLPILLVITIASFVMWFKQRRHMTAY